MTTAPVLTVPGRIGTGTVVLVGARVVGAALLATNAGIHAYLWDAGYRTVPTIGVLLLLDVVAASALTLAVLVAPRRLLAPVALLGALLEVGTVAGLLWSTHHPLFGFTESPKATLYGQSVWTEVAGAVLLAGLAVLAYRRSRRATVAAR